MKDQEEELQEVAEQGGSLDREAGEYQADDVDSDTEEQVEVAEADPEMEARAREMGWVPQDKFRGDPEHWRPADEFVRRGEEFLPIVKSQLGRAQQETQRLAQVMEQKEREFQQRLESMERIHKKAAENQRMQMLRQIEEQKDEAFALGDKDAYDRAKQREADLFNDFVDYEDQPQKERQAPEQPQVQLTQAHQAWAEQNQWFFNDPVLNAAAQTEQLRVSQMHPGLSIAEQLDEITRGVKQRFPEKFNIRTRQQKPGVSAVSAASRTSGPRSGAKGWNDIPQQDRAAAKSFLEDGLFKSKEEYAKEYWGQDQ